MKKLVIITCLILILIISFTFTYKIYTNPVSKESKLITIEIKENSTYYTISNILKNNNLIKSELFYKLYIKINKPNNLQIGIYELNQNMSVKEIINVLEKGSTYNPNVVKLTFNEGINIRKIASIISQNTNNTIDDVYNTLKDEEYLKELINKYWFINEDILNKKIYYSLEGYLFPDTYEFEKDANVKDIFNKMLDTMGEFLKDYKIENVHKILTLASIVELESANTDDRAGIAGVFYNRLNSNWPLGSDVTTFYASKIEIYERDLYQSELDAVNDYNTRSISMAGKLPVGPICSPSKESILATINPSKHEFYYFAADKNLKTYFTKTYTEHLALIKKLKDENLWYQR